MLCNYRLTLPSNAIMEPPDVCTAPDAFFEGRTLGVPNTNKIASFGVPIHGSSVSYVTDFGTSKWAGTAAEVDLDKIVCPNHEV